MPSKSKLIHLQNSSNGASVTGPSCNVEPPALLCSMFISPNSSMVLRTDF